MPEMLAEQPPEMPLPDPQPRGDVVDTGAVAVLEGAVAGVPIEVHRGNRSRFRGTVSPFSDVVSREASALPAAPGGRSG